MMMGSRPIMWQFYIQIIKTQLTNKKHAWRFRHLVAFIYYWHTCIVMLWLLLNLKPVNMNDRIPVSRAYKAENTVVMCWLLGLNSASCFAFVLFVKQILGTMASTINNFFTGFILGIIRPFPKVSFTWIASWDGRERTKFWASYWIMKKLKKFKPPTYVVTSRRFPTRLPRLQISMSNYKSLNEDSTFRPFSSPQ